MSTTVGNRRAAAEEAKRRAAEGQLSHRQILLVFSGLMLGMFLAALDQTIVLTAIRTIADDLDGLSEQAWATTAFLITATIATPLYGKLSDLYGRKPFFIFAISIFLVGSLACTLAQNMYELAAFRAIQGLGAGGLFSLALAIIADVVPARERAKYQGYFLAVFGTSSVLGPLIGGFFADQDYILGVDGWRWVFLVNLPIGALALIVVGRVLQLPHTRREHRIDWPGALAISLCLVPLLIVAEQGQTWGWDSGRAVICYVIGAVGLVAFLLAERWAGSDALIPLQLFRGPVFALTSAAGLLIGVGMFGVMSVVPQYLQIVKGASPTKAGFLTLPLVLGIMIASVLSGQLTSRTGRYKIFPVIGTLLMVVGMLLMNRLDADTSLFEADVYMFVFGLGLGNCMQTIMLAVQNAVPPRDMGVATSSATFFRQMGGTIGTAAFLSILFSTVATKIGDALARFAPTQEFRAALARTARERASGASSPRATADIKILEVVQSRGGGGGSSVLRDSSFLKNADPTLARPFVEGFADSMQPVFITGAAVVLVAFVLLLFMKEIPLRNQAGIQARIAEEQAAAAAANGAMDGSVGPTGQVTVGSYAESVIEQGRDGALADTQAESTIPQSTVTAGQRQRIPEPVGAPGNSAGQPVPVAVHAGRYADGERAAEHGAGRPNGLLAGSGAGWFATASAQQPIGGTGHGGGTPNGAVPISGRVRTTDGTGIGSAALTLIDLAGRQVGRGQTGADGGYRLDAPAAGTYVLIAAAVAHQPEASTVVVGGGPIETDIVLSGTSGLFGWVTSAEAAEPVASATTTLADSRGEVVGAQLTGNDGGYAFRELVPGNYTLVVSADSYRPIALAVSVPTTGDNRQDVELIGGSRLHGVARRAIDGRPIQDARITLLDAAGNVVGVTNTDDAGEYTFGDLHAGDYTVIASGYPPVASTLRVSLGQHGQHDVELGHPDS